jgi:hypothetical protein
MQIALNLVLFFARSIGGPGLHHHLPVSREAFSQLSLDLGRHSCVTASNNIKSLKGKLYIF